MAHTTAALYIVATPIGNLEDISSRAIRLLSSVDVIAAEDTRHSGKLLHHFGIKTKMVAVHEHNERVQIPELIAQLCAGKSIALISDAGTPLISDPGFHLVRAARQAGVAIIPVPGPCAAIVALSAAGLPSDHFVFEGFPPAKAAARRAVYEKLRDDPRTLIFYESPHRILESLQDMVEVFGPEREAVLARELTKQYETIRAGTLAELYATVHSDTDQQRGEFVLLIHGAAREQREALDAEAERILNILLEDLPVSQSVALAAKITGFKKNRLYDYALRIKPEK